MDTSVDPGSGISVGADCYDLELLSNGKILIAGDFVTYNGAVAKSITRLNSDGSIDGTFL